MTKFYAQEKRVFDINKVTVVGSPTITNDGVISSTDMSTNYAKANFDIFTLQNKSWHIRQKIHLDLTSEKNSEFATLLGGGTYFRYNKGWNSLVFNGYITTNGTATNETQVFISIEAIRTKILNVTANVTEADLIIDLYYTIEKQEYYFTATYGNTVWESRVFTGTAEAYNSQLSVLYNTKGYLRLGENADLTKTEIYVDGELVYSPTKPICYLERRKEGFDLSKFNVVGSPTITEAGVTSGFSEGNYLKTSATFIMGDVLKVNGSFVPTAKVGANFYACRIEDLTNNSFASVYYRNYLQNVVGNSWSNSIPATTYQINIPIEYEFIIQSNGNATCTYKQNGNVLGTTNISGFSAFTQDSSIKIYFGSEGKEDTKDFSIDLSQFSITVDGKEVFTGAKEKYYAMQGGI